jgi:multiple sugar transport system substrate-binding protein
MKIIKGITWDHPRGYAPLREAASVWSKEKKISVRWDIRTLKDFGDCPIEALIDRYDLIVMDHPYVGNASVNGLLLPLEAHLPERFMRLQGKESIGKSFESYWYNGHCWALPIDAAAQVAAYRTDLVERYNWEIPDNMLKVKQAAADLPEGIFMGIPLCATDCWCVFLSICSLYAGRDFFSEQGINMVTGEWALDQLHSWKSFLYPGSFGMNPIQMFEHMSSHHDIVYTPYVFGYNNYSRKGWRNEYIRFCHSPVCRPHLNRTLLGGAGLAVSAKTGHRDECLEFIQFILSTERQKGLYFREQGQPAHLSAWLDPLNDALCTGFFSDTLPTMEHAYMRPRHPGFNRFQEEAANYLHSRLLYPERPRDTIRKLNLMYQNLVDGAL